MAEIHEDNCGCYECTIDRALTKLDKLKRRNYMLLATLQKTYRKHQMNDDTIGWEELGNEMRDTLCNVMGDYDFQKFIKLTKPDVIKDGESSESLP